MELLGPARIRALATDLGLRPTKTWGQNFVIDANTVRRIVRSADLDTGERVLEVGPGLGSLSLALLEAGHPVLAVEIDPVLAGALPGTLARSRTGQVGTAAGSAAEPGLEVICADALRLTELPGEPPTAVVANLPYNVAVPVLLTLLERFPLLRHGLVMVQAEVAERLAAGPGEPAYGVPSVKAAWYAAVRRAGSVSRSVFWPVPGVDSGLVAFTRREPPDGDRSATFQVIDAAFAQRRKTLRAALARLAGSGAAAELALRDAGVDPGSRGEDLPVQAFAAIAGALR